MQLRTWARVVCCLCALAYASLSCAQAAPWIPSFRLMGAQQGLSNSAVDALVRDQQGVVWMATEDGLIQHAGRGFKTFRHADTAWLPGNSIQALHVDANNRLWISVMGHGVVRLDADRIHAQHFDTHVHSKLVDVWAIQDDGDDVWFGTANDGLLRMNLRTRRIQTYLNATSDSPAGREKIVALLRRAPGDIWVATAAGLFRWRQGQMSIIDLPIGQADDVVYSLAQDAHQVWIGTASGVFSLSNDNRVAVPTWSAAFARPNAAIKIESAGSGQLWIATQRGLKRIEHNQSREVRMEGAMHGKPVRALYRQADGALWATAPGIGLAYLRPNWKDVTQLRALPAKGDGLASVEYRAIAEARDQGWWLAGLDGVLEQVSAEGQVLTRVSGIAKAVRPKAVLASDQGVVWLAGRDELLRIQDGRVRAVFDANARFDALPDASLGELRDAGLGRFWLSFPGWGVQLRDAQGRVLRTVQNAPDAPIGLQSIDALPGGDVFAVVEGRLHHLTQASDAFVPLLTTSVQDLDAVAIASPTHIWAHAPSGLYEFERRHGIWSLKRTLPAETKWRDLEAKGFRVGSDGRVWLATARGLFVFGENGTRVFDVSNGLSNQQLLAGSLAVSTSSNVAAAAAENGVVMQFLSSAQGVDAEWPRLAPAQMFARSNGRWRTLNKDGARFIAPSDSTEIRVQMHAIAYDDPDAVHYKMRVQDLDRDWIDLGGTYERILSGLAPGRYRIDLRAVDGRGRATDIQTIQFELKPHWWQTSWFKLCMCLLLLCFTAGVIWAVVKRAHRRRELKLAREHAQQHAAASSAKSTFLATFGHEIRTPMTGVMGMAELLATTALSQQQMQRVNSIRKSSEHLLRIVDDALDLARIEAGKLDFVAKPFEVRALLEEIAEWATPLSLRKGVQFVFSCDETGVECVSGDVVRIRQVLMNLVGNALKFTAHGTVTLSHRAIERDLHLFCVDDTGPGMRPEQCQRVFERFEQADGALTAHRHGGSGLGLAISAELVKGMGGRLSVESVPGVGSRFSVELPLPQTDRPMPVPTVVTHRRTPHTFDVLLVEDDDAVADVLSELITQAGHRVTHVLNGLHALVHLSGGHFDVAVLDLDLPAINGFDLARQMRNSGFTGAMLAVSAHANANAESDARQAGFSRFLRKPIRGVDLLDAIESALLDLTEQRAAIDYGKVRFAP